jgi:hypothetical protein
MEQKDIAVTCHDNLMPDFVGPELERLYGNTYSSVLQLETYGYLDAGVSTYVVRQGGHIVTLLLFRREQQRVQVLNEGVKLSGKELNRFAEYIFATFRSVDVVSFYAIETDGERFALPVHRTNCLEDIAMKLPPTAEEYLAGLGKNTRRNIKRYLDRLQRTFPSFRFETAERQAIDERQVREIIRFNHARMADKNKTSGIDELEVQRIIRMAKTCGMIGIATINEQVCAGTISYRTGENYFLYVLAHAPTYDEFWIGILCCYMTIRECIARGGKEFHFLWGRYEYKFTLGAAQRNLDRVTIYRSRLHLVLNARIALQDALKGYSRRARLWLQYEARHQSGIAPSFAAFALNTMRSLRSVSAAWAGYRENLLSRLRGREDADMGPVARDSRARGNP